MNEDEFPLEQGKPFEEWTSCEMWGHYFIDGFCTDCGEPE